MLVLYHQWQLEYLKVRSPEETPDKFVSPTLSPTKSFETPNSITISSDPICETLLAPHTFSITSIHIIHRNHGAPILCRRELQNVRMAEGHALPPLRTLLTGIHKEWHNQVYYRHNPQPEQRKTRREDWYIYFLRPPLYV